MAMTTGISAATIVPLPAAPSASLSTVTALPSLRSSQSDTPYSTPTEDLYMSLDSASIVSPSSVPMATPTMISGYNSNFEDTRQSSSYNDDLIDGQLLVAHSTPGLSAQSSRPKPIVL